MEEELKTKFGADVELVAGSGGVFEIYVDARKIFSKAASGRFPEDGEIVRLIAGG
ncbi:MAG: hypothetical protein BM485_09530 [Desulfobulbaceae bacterium DB1]|nr:MAG: hypothetical protein BM485_09530 [Desulfobulbaceae bacterium DB1]